MKTNRVMRMAAVGVLWLSLSAGCRKDPPDPKQLYSCSDGTCCNSDTRHYIYDGSIEGLQVNLIGGSYVTAVYFEEPLPGNYLIQEVRLCNLSRNKVSGLQPAAIIGGNFATYKYRVWGKLYYDPDYQTLTATPIEFLYIDRIDEVK